MTIEALISGLQNQDLRIPEDYHESVRRYTMTGKSQTSGRERNRDEIPFNRQVDIWWLALCVGIQEGRRTKLDKKSIKFVRAGEVFPSDPWRLDQLQLLAVSVTGSTDILSKPGELIAMANEYAATGLPILIDEAIGSQVPIWAMTDFFKERLQWFSK